MFVGQNFEATIDQYTYVLAVFKRVGFGARLTKPEVFHRMRVCMCLTLGMTLAETE